MDATRLSIILVSPQQPGNIGAVCRAMDNFGVSDLRLVNPCHYLHPEARKFAAHAAYLLGQATVHDSLISALQGVDLSLAATRRGGRMRGRLYDSTELPALLAGCDDGRVALVFGPEDNGLSSSDIACCSCTATIATAHQNGSLNLAQAVLIFLYELARRRTVEAQRDDKDGEF